MGRRGNPNDNAKAESFMKTLPRAIRGSPRPATCQKRRVKLSNIRAPLLNSPERRGDWNPFSRRSMWDEEDEF